MLFRVGFTGMAAFMGVVAVAAFVLAVGALAADALSAARRYATGQSISVSSSSAGTASGSLR